MTVGYAFVVGDLFHVGHLQLLETAKSQCDFLIVGVLTDKAVTKYKRQPVIPFNERVSVVRALKCADMVVSQKSRDPTLTLKRLHEDGWHIDFVFHGDDWAEIPGVDYIKESGMVICRLPYYTLQSTTKIIEKIRKEAT